MGSVVGGVGHFSSLAYRTEQRPIDHAVYADLFQNKLGLIQQTEIF